MPTTSIPNSSGNGNGPSRLAARISRAAADAADDPLSAATPAKDTRSLFADLYRKYNHLPRATDCGHRHLFTHNEKPKAFVAALRCRRNNGCPFCRAVNLELWSLHITEQVPEVAYLWCGPVDDAAAARKRVRRRGGSYAQIAQPCGECVIVSDKPFEGSEETTNPSFAIKNAIHAIPTRSPGRPVTTSRDWKRPDADASDYTHQGRITATTKQVRELVEALGGTAKVGKPGAGFLRRLNLTLPCLADRDRLAQRFAGRAGLSNEQPLVDEPGRPLPTGQPPGRPPIGQPPGPDPSGLARGVVAKGVSDA